MQNSNHSNVICSYCYTFGKCLQAAGSYCQQDLCVYTAWTLHLKVYWDSKSWLFPFFGDRNGADIKNNLAMICQMIQELVACVVFCRQANFQYSGKSSVCPERLAWPYCTVLMWLVTLKHCCGLRKRSGSHLCLIALKNMKGRGHTHRVHLGGHICPGFEQGYPTLPRFPCPLELDSPPSENQPSLCCGRETLCEGVGGNLIRPPPLREKQQGLMHTSVSG